MSVLDLKLRDFLAIAADMYTTFCLVVTSAMIFGLIMNYLMENFIYK
jgi:hypothetical protein